MINIYTISDKALMGKQINTLSAYLAECFFKNNLKIIKQNILSTAADLSFINEDFKDGNIYIFLVDKAHGELNQKLCDLTKSVIVENPYAKNSIQNYYKKINQPMEKDCELEWKLPSLARVIVNPNHTTQGYILDYKNSIYCILPNDYDDARQMFDDIVLEYILKDQKKKYKNYTFKTFGLTPNGILSILNEEIKNKDKVSINLFEKPLEVDVVVKAQEGNEQLDIVAKKVFLKLDKYIYSVEDIPIEKVVYNLLKLNELKICFIEDITAGKLCSKLVSQNDDAKEFIEKSFILPNKQSKIEFLGLEETVLNSNQDINPNIVYEMAAKVISESKANIVVASLGNIKNENNNSNGLCYIAVGDKREIHVYKNFFKGNINEIMESVTVASYFYLIKKLKKNTWFFDENN